MLNNFKLVSSMVSISGSMGPKPNGQFVITHWALSVCLNVLLLLHFIVLNDLCQLHKLWVNRYLYHRLCDLPINSIVLFVHPSHHLSLQIQIYQIIQIILEF